MQWANRHSFNPSFFLLWADFDSAPGKPIVAGTFFQTRKSVATNHSFQPANLSQEIHSFKPSKSNPG
jgi:hypothetical protein